MIYTRSTACKLAPLDPEHFRTLDRRNHLAIRDRKTMADEAAGKTWLRMSASDVLMLAAQARLLQDHGKVRGISPETSKLIVGNTGDFISDVINTSGPVDAWLGYVSKPRNGEHAGGHVTGPLQAVMAQIADDGDLAERVYLVNLSKVLREVRARASDNGIEFP